MVPRWSHRQPEVRKALDEAAQAGLRVKDTPGHHGHSWGYVDCTNPDCIDPVRRYYVNSTPQNEGNEAARLRRFIKRHQHKDKRGATPDVGRSGRHES
jgi:hypothetical protein